MHKFKKLLSYSDKYNFDIIPFSDKYVPIAKNYLDPENIVKNNTPEIFNSVKNVGIAFKENTGIQHDGKYLTCIDIDCHNEDRAAKELTDDLFDEILLKLATVTNVNRKKLLQVSEKTKREGYHIFVCTDKLSKCVKKKLDKGVLLEVFNSNHCATVAPSQGYENEAGLDTINFDVAWDTYIPMDELTKLLFPFDKESTAEDLKGSNISVDFDGKSKKATEVKEKIYDLWPNFKAFASGNSDKDWDAISPGESVYDYVRYNIMPFMVLLGDEEKFLDIIGNYGTHYQAQWKTYPTRWLSIDAADRPIGKDGRKYLSQIGYFKGDSKETGSQFHQRYVLNVLPELYKDCKLVEDTPYVYNEEEKYFIPMGKDVIASDIRNYYLMNEEKAIMPAIVGNMVVSTMEYLRAYAMNKSIDWVKPYHMDRDRRYTHETHVVFQDGTLVIGKEGYDFRREEFFKDRVPLYKINCEFDPSLMVKPKDSIVWEWFETKFPQKEVFNFVQLFFGNLLVPTYNPSIILSVVTEQGGTGKSTLASCLREIFEPHLEDKILPRKVIEIKLDKLGDRFVGWDLGTSLLNISEETDGRMNHGTLKTLVALERTQVERKGLDTYYIKPITKHISFANKIPEAVTDGGMQRRLVVFRADPKPVRPQIEGNMYSKIFNDDWKSLLSFMLVGLQELIAMNFPDLSMMWLKSKPLAHHRNLVKENNSSVERFMTEQGYRELLKAKECTIVKSDLYGSYKMWCDTEGIKSPVMLKIFNNQVISGGYILEKRTDTEAGRKRCFTVEESYMEELTELIEMDIV